MDEFYQIVIQIGWLDKDQPTLIIRVFSQQFKIVFDILIDLNNRSANKPNLLPIALNTMLLTK